MSGSTSKTCSLCHVTWPAEMFGIHRGRADGLQGHCKLCARWINIQKRTVNGRYAHHANANASDRHYHTLGVRVAEAWLDPAVFVGWVIVNLGLPPGLDWRGFTLDRIGGGSSPYAPGNLRWATPQQQMENRTVSRRRLIEALEAGETFAAIAREFNVHPVAISSMAKAVGHGT